MPKSRFFLIFLFVVIFLVIFLTVTFWEYTQDDVFITYVYSRNIAEGNGFVFNPGERVQGTTTPLYALVMAVVYLITDDLLHAGNFLSAIFLLITIVLGMRLFNKQQSRFGYFAFSLIVASSPLVYLCFGMETLFYCAVLILAFWFWANDQTLYAIVTAGILTWIRSDGVVLAGVIGLLAWYQNIRDRHSLLNGKAVPWQLGLSYLLVIAPWYIFATFYFGSPLPNTFSAKQELLSGWDFITSNQGGLNWWKILYFENNPLAVVAFPAVGVGMSVMLRDKYWRLIPIWSIFYTVGYTMLNVTTYWYFAPLFIGLVICAVVGAEWLTKQLLRLGLSRQLTIGSAFLLVILFAGLSTSRAYQLRRRPERVETYIVAGQWIEQNTPEDSLFLVRDLGVVGYYAERQTVDTPGLITPQLTFLNEDPYAVADLKPDYILGVQYWNMQRLYGQDWFKALYRPVVQFNTIDDVFSPMILYQRRPMPVFSSLNNSGTVVQGVPFGIDYPYEVYIGYPIPDKVQAIIYDADNEVVTEIESAFWGHNYPEPLAKTNTLLRDTVVIDLNLPPGRYTWSIFDGFYQGSFEVVSVEESEHYLPLNDTYQWADFAQLKGIYTQSGHLTTWSGGEVEIGLVWQAIAPATDDYSVFVHVIDQQGHIVTQSDGYPVHQTIYTRFWYPGEIIHDIRRIQLPLNLPTSEYHVIVGWYDWRTNERFQLTDASDAVELPIIIENKHPNMQH